MSNTNEKYNVIQIIVLNKGCEEKETKTSKKITHNRMSHLLTLLDEY